jgi:plasmid maintenance system antidote protein VapI
LLVSAKSGKDDRGLQTRNPAALEVWLNLQKQYEPRLAERRSGPEIRRLPRRAAA